MWGAAPCIAAHEPPGNLWGHAAVCQRATSGPPQPTPALQRHQGPQGSAKARPCPRESCGGRPATPLCQTGSPQWLQQPPHQGCPPLHPPYLAHQEAKCTPESCGRPPVARGVPCHVLPRQQPPPRGTSLGTPTCLTPPCTSWGGVKIYSALRAGVWGGRRPTPPPIAGPSPRKCCHGVLAHHPHLCKGSGQG